MLTLLLILLGLAGGIANADAQSARTKSLIADPSQTADIARWGKDANTISQLTKFARSSSYIRDMAICSDGTFVIVAYNDAMVRFDLDTNSEAWTLTGTNKLQWIALSPDCSYFLTGMAGGKDFWKVDSSQSCGSSCTTNTMQPPGLDNSGLAFGYNNALSAQDGVIHADGYALVISGYGFIQKFDMSSTGYRNAGTTVVGKYATSNPSTTDDGCGTSVTYKSYHLSKIALSNDGQRAFTAGYYSKMIREINLSDMCVQTRNEATLGALTNLALSPDDSFIMLTAASNTGLLIVDLTDGADTNSYAIPSTNAQAHPPVYGGNGAATQLQDVGGVVFHPTDGYAIVASNKGYLSKVVPQAPVNPSCSTIKKSYASSDFQAMYNDCNSRSYCSAKIKTKKGKAKCKSKNCKKCKTDMNCCNDNPEGCIYDPLKKKPCKNA